MKHFPRIVNKTLYENRLNGAFHGERDGDSMARQTLQDIKATSAFPSIDGEGLNKAQPAIFISRILGNWSGITSNTANKGRASDTKAGYSSLNDNPAR